ncbi:MAG: transporter [Bacilli bacterium]|nr:transporter [Bacilli bacterium]
MIQLNTYWSTAATVTLPIMIAVICGVLLNRFRSIDTKTLIDVSLYVLSPCLVLYALVDGGGTMGSVLAVLEFTVLNMSLLWGISTICGRLARFQPPVRSALTMTTVFSNCVNYGLPVVLLAYGTKGFALAAIYVIPQIVLVNSLGIYIASSATRSPLSALREVLKMPVVYAAAAGCVMLLLHLHWPQGLDSTFHVLGGGYSAVVLIVLGVQLGRANWRGFKRLDLWMAVALRVVAVPLVTELCLWILHIHGLLGSVLFLEASMPAAANASIMVERFGGDKSLVAMTVAITTVISFFLLPLEILLGS